MLSRTGCGTQNRVRYKWCDREEKEILQRERCGTHGELGMVVGACGRLSSSQPKSLTPKTGPFSFLNTQVLQPPVHHSLAWPFHHSNGFLPDVGRWAPHNHRYFALDAYLQLNVFLAFSKLFILLKYFSKSIGPSNLVFHCKYSYKSEHFTD